MKRLNRTISLISILSIALLGSCSPKNKDNYSWQDEPFNGSNKYEEGQFYATYKGEEYKVGSTDNEISTYVGDKNAIIVAHPSTASVGGVNEMNFQSSDESVVAVGKSNGVLTPKKAGTATIRLKEVAKKESVITFKVTVEESVPSTGAISYVDKSYEEKAEILGALEKYAVDNYLTGITMFSDGSKACYNTRYVPSCPSYISGYGWGTWREGTLTDNIQKPLDDGYSKDFYQVATTSLPAHANAMNASGSDVSDIAGNFNTSYFSTRMNEKSSGYEWYPQTATDNDPIPVAADGSLITGAGAKKGTYNTWRIHVKTGDNFVYRTNSQLADIKKYDGQAVKLEDYLTPLKFMLTSFNGQYRGAELTKGVSGFDKASATYYSKTSRRSDKLSSDAIWDDELWHSTGMDDVIKTGTDDSGEYIQFRLLYPCTRFYAKYYLSSSLYSPLPADFIKYWGGRGLGKSPDVTASGTRGSYTPVDTMLYTGPYYITEWGTKRITFTKNDQFFYKEDNFNGNIRKVYQIPGFQYTKVEDRETLKNYFLDGSIDSYGPDKNDLTGTFSADSGNGNNGMSWRKYNTKGSANFKLNINATTEDQWKQYFGPTGSVYQHDSAYVNNKSAHSFLKSRKYMSNIHFLNFLSHSMDRKTLCESRGAEPTQSYLSDNYLIDPEQGISYNDSDAHKAVLADRYPETYGFNVDAAKRELKQAMEDVIEPMAQNKELTSEKSGAGAGTSANKYKVTITMNWMNTGDKKEYADVFTEIEKIFSEVIKQDFNDGYKLDLQIVDGSADYQHVYDLMKHGEFDLGFGAISGGDLDPINFMEVLKSDNSSSFTLNWGPDTSKVGSEERTTITYDKKRWSYDALWNAANFGVLLDKNSNICNAENVSKQQTLKSGAKYNYESVNSTDKSATYKLSFKTLVEGGAKAIELEVSNSEKDEIYEIDKDLNATAANNYVGTLLLDSEYNSYQEYNETSKDYESIDCSTVTCTVKYTVTLNGQDTRFTISFSLLTYYGINNG